MTDRPAKLKGRTKKLSTGWLCRWPLLIDSPFDLPRNVDYYSYKQTHYLRGIPMRTIQMTLEDDLVQAVDKIVKQTHTTRSAFTRAALKDAINNFKISQLEQKHRKGYEQQPASKEEFSVWENEQKWEDS